MMRRNNIKSHILEVHDDISSYVLALIGRCEIKISGVFMGICCRLSLVVKIEKEKFKFRICLEYISHLFGLR